MHKQINANRELEKTSGEIFRQKKILYALLDEITQAEKSWLSENYRSGVLSCFSKSCLSEAKKKECYGNIKADLYGEKNLSAIHKKLLLNDGLLEVVRKIAASDPDSYRKIFNSHMGCIFEESVFEFPDIMLLDDRSFQKVLMSVSMETIAVAFIGESHALKDKLFRNVSKRTSSGIKRLMHKKIFTLETSDVIKKQGLILKAVHRLIKQDGILFPGEVIYD